VLEYLYVHWSASVPVKKETAQAPAGTCAVTMNE